MDEKDLKTVRRVIRERGDSFWVDNPFNNDKEMGGNEFLFDEIVGMLNESGLDLVLVPK
jgi:hypothetical protein